MWRDGLHGESLPSRPTQSYEGRRNRLASTATSTAPTTTIARATTGAFLSASHQQGRSAARHPFSFSTFSISSLSLQSQVLKEELLDGGHIVISVELNDVSNYISSYALVDCGATGYAFVDEEFGCNHNLPLFKLKTPHCLKVIDGRPIESGLITHLSRVQMTINGHKENIPMFVTKLRHYPIVLGLPWLCQHDVNISFAKNTLTFDSKFCLNHCCSYSNAVMIKGISIPIPEKPNIAMVTGSTFARLVKGKGHIALTIYEIDQALHAYELQDRARQVARHATIYAIIPSIRSDMHTAVTAEASAMAAASKDDKIRELVPTEYHKFLPLFKKAVADTLPPHRPYNYRITTREGFVPWCGPLYSLSRFELQALQEWLDENLSKGFIRALSSPAGAPILFVKKPGGGFRLCVDYRGLNEGTIKNRYSLPLIRETLMRLSKACYYTMLDVRGAYNLLRITEGDEWKAAFWTRYGLYELLVMPFGLTNTSADFQRFINDVLHPFLDLFCTAYLEDILVYSEMFEDHCMHVKQVLEVLSKAGLHLKPEKCHFHKSVVKYLGLIITADGIKMDPTKVKAVVDWVSPRNLHDVCAFLGLANFYRRFIVGYSRVVVPMVALTKTARLTEKEVRTQFEWSADCEQAFQALKRGFTTAPVLHHFDPQQAIVMETDASDYVFAGILSQYDDGGTLHPIAYFSKKHLPAECNYEIYDKELIEIIRCFEEWRPELESSLHPIQILSDHKNLKYFMSTKLLSCRQAR